MVATFFTFLGLGAGLFAFLVFTTAESAIHEGLALLLLLTAAVLLVGAGIVEAINSAENAVKRLAAGLRNSSEESKEVSTPSS